MTEIQTTMMFLEPWIKKKENPYYRTNPNTGFDIKNFDWLDYNVKVKDARPNMGSFTLDQHGFAFKADSESASPNVLNVLKENLDDNVKETYYPHVERLVKNATGAKEAIVFNHTVRRRVPSLGLFEGSKGRQQPASTVHCDQTPKGAIRRVQQYLGDDAEEKLKGRCQIINVWRPIVGPVKDWPLAVMDGQSIDPDNIHPTDLWKFEFDVLGQTTNISYSDKQAWYYLKDHAVSEVTFIKIWDSGKDVPAKLCPHCAFEDPTTPDGAPLRESVEARCLVFF